jgi:hypothetical protein
MKLDITHMLTKSTSPFYGIVPGNASIPLGSVVLLVTFGETRENYRTEYIKFEVADFETSYQPSWTDQLSPSSWRYPTTSDGNGSGSDRVECLDTQNRNLNLKPETDPNTDLGQNLCPKPNPRITETRLDTRNPLRVATYEEQSRLL